MTRRARIGAIVLLAVVVATWGGLAAWKYAAIGRANDAFASQPEPAETVTAAVASERAHQATTTSIGTVLALRSVALRNELAGTVSKVKLVPGQIVEPGALLVALDVSVELADLKAQQAQAALAATVLRRMETMGKEGAVPRTDVDRSRAERDVSLATIARTKAIIARKTIRAPFRARVGIADVHPGQYLEQGTLLTTLQGVDSTAHVDFTVAQRVAAGLRVGGEVSVQPRDDAAAIAGEIVAIDSRVDPNTRNAVVRAKVTGAADSLAPGGSVRVVVPVGRYEKAVAIPASALRKGPQGDQVFVIAPDPQGKTRAHPRRVQSGAAVGDQVLILSGLRVGEKVAASGSFKLREGALVAVAPDPAAAKRHERTP
jgi:membrane fusion protein, multidrug efflux system